MAPDPGALGSSASADASVIRGHQVYVTECAACHRARSPQGYSRERWGAILPRMTARARLSSQDAAAVRAYVDAALDTTTASPSEPSR